LRVGPGASPAPLRPAHRRSAGRAGLLV